MLGTQQGDSRTPGALTGTQAVSGSLRQTQQHANEEAEQQEGREEEEEEGERDPERVFRVGWVAQEADLRAGRVDRREVSRGTCWWELGRAGQLAGLLCPGLGLLLGWAAVAPVCPAEGDVGSWCWRLGPHKSGHPRLHFVVTEARLTWVPCLFPGCLQLQRQLYEAENAWRYEQNLPPLPVEPRLPGTEQQLSDLRKLLRDQAGDWDGSTGDIHLVRTRGTSSLRCRSLVASAGHRLLVVNGNARGVCVWVLDRVAMLTISSGNPLSLPCD